MNLAKVKAALAKNKKPLLALGAGVVVVLGLWARKQKAGDVSTDGAGVSGDGIYASGSSAYPSAYTPGSGTYDSSITDLYNAMQRQLEEIAGLIPVTDPYAPQTPAPAPTPEPKPSNPVTAAVTKVIDKARALSASDKVVALNYPNDTFYRQEADGTLTPLSPSTWSAFRLTDAGKAYKVTHLGAADKTNIERATKNSWL